MVSNIKSVRAGLIYMNHPLKLSSDKEIAFYIANQRIEQAKENVKKWRKRQGEK